MGLDIISDDEIYDITFDITFSFCFLLVTTKMRRKNEFKGDGCLHQLPVRRLKEQGDTIPKSIKFISDLCSSFNKSETKNCIFSSCRFHLLSTERNFERNVSNDRQEN